MADDKKLAFGKVESTTLGSLPVAGKPTIEGMDDKMKAALQQAAKADIAPVNQTSLPADNKPADWVAENAKNYPDVMERGKMAMEQSRQDRGIEKE